VQIDVITLKAGRTAAHARVLLRQDSEAVVELTLVLSDVPDGADLAHRGPTPGASDHIAVKPGRSPGLSDRVQVRYRPGHGPRDDAAPGERAVVEGMLALHNGEEPDALFCLLAVDSVAPSVFLLGQRRWAPTVQMTTHVRAVPAPGPLEVRVELGQLSDGWFDETALVTDATGVVVAQAWQLARLPRAA
jgi:hypothetical protein